MTRKASWCRLESRGDGCHPLPDDSFDALVSEFTIHPVPLITQVGHSEIARVLRPTGKMIVTHVIAIQPPPEASVTALQAMGLDCIATLGADARQKLTDLGITLPTQVFNDRWELEVGGVRIDLVHVGGHTPGATVVHLPAAGVL